MPSLVLTVHLATVALHWEWFVIRALHLIPIQCILFEVAPIKCGPSDGTRLVQSIRGWKIQDWTTPQHAIGGYPSLVENGTITNEVYPGQTVWSSTDWNNNPRTAIGSTSNGEFLLVTLDGRTSFGSGVTTNDMADLMVMLGAVDAIGLDGGVLAWPSRTWHNDVVNQLR